MAGLGFFALILAAILLIGTLLFPDAVARMGSDQIAGIIYMLALALFIGGGALSRIGPATAGRQVSFQRAVFYLAIWGAIAALLFAAPHIWEWARAALDPNVVT